MRGRAVFLVERDRTIAWRFLADSYKVRPSADELLRAIDASTSR